MLKRAVVFLAIVVCGCGAGTETSQSKSIKRAKLTAEQRTRQSDLLDIAIRQYHQGDLVGSDSTSLAELLDLADARREEPSGTTYFFILSAKHSTEGSGAFRITVKSDSPCIDDVQMLVPDY